MRIFNLQDFKRYAAELAGTFFLVLFGTGAVIIDNVTKGGVGHTGICATFGLIVIAMIYCFGRISGAHINPAVTIGFTLRGLFDKKQVLPYIIAQTIGACLASGLLKFAFPTDLCLGGTLPTGSSLQSFITEFIITFILMFVILQNKWLGKFAPAAVGLTIFVEAYITGPISGASMNPARSIGPAIVSGQLSSLWIYILAPILGAALISLTLPSPKERVQKMQSEVLSFGEDLGEAPLS